MAFLSGISSVGKPLVGPQRAASALPYVDFFVCTALHRFCYCSSWSLVVARQTHDQPVLDSLHKSHQDVSRKSNTIPWQHRTPTKVESLAATASNALHRLHLASESSGREMTGAILPWYRLGSNFFYSVAFFVCVTAQEQWTACGDNSTHT